MFCQDNDPVREFCRLHFVYHLLEIKQCVRAPWVNGVRNPSTTAAEAVAAAEGAVPDAKIPVIRIPENTKNAAKRLFLHALLLDSRFSVNDNVLPVVLPDCFPGTLVAEVLIS